MPANFKLYLYIGLAVALIALGSWAYSFYNDYQALKLERDKLQQNELALRDSINQMADSLTKTTAFVRDLNSKLQKKSSDYIALKARFAAFIDSVRDSGSVSPVVTDSTVTVPFSGSKGIASYTGFTLYNLTTKHASWDLSLSFPVPIEVGTDLIEEDGIWKWETRSLTSGVKVKGTGVLDNDTYRRLQKYAPPDPPKRFMLGGVIGQHGGLGAGYKFDTWTILGYYSLINKYDDVYKNINIGVFWSPF
jgi:hypothetical protein